MPKFGQGIGNLDKSRKGTEYGRTKISVGSRIVGEIWLTLAGLRGLALKGALESERKNGVAWHCQELS